MSIYFIRLFLDRRTILERPKPLRHALTEITQYHSFNDNVRNLMNDSSGVTGNSEVTNDHLNSNFGKRIFNFEFFQNH